jgi:hypothetical protein
MQSEMKDGHHSGTKLFLSSLLYVNFQISVYFFFNWFIANCNQNEWYCSLKDTFQILWVFFLYGMNIQEKDDC